MPVEFLLLLPAVDVQLARVRVLANRRRAAVRLGLLDAQPPEIGFDFRQTRRGGRLALARRPSCVARLSMLCASSR